jgi:glycosylphosphatidylinositol transamidase
MGTKEPPVTTSRPYHSRHTCLGPSSILCFVVANSPKIGAHAFRSSRSKFDLPTQLGLAWLCALVLLAPRFIDKLDSNTTKTAPIWMLLRSFNLCFASAVISATSVLNFSLAAVLAFLFGVPLSFSGPTDDALTSVTLRLAYLLLAIFWFTPAWNVMDQAMWDWEFLGGYFAPFICLIYVPIVWQAVIVSSLTNRL